MKGRTKQPRAARVPARRGAGEVIVKSVVRSAAAEGKSPLLEVSVSKCAPNVHRFVVSAAVAVPAEEVYALIDWADERNRYRQMGDTVTALDDEGRRFRVAVSYMRGLRWDYEVEEAVKPQVYACTCVPSSTADHLERSHEHFRFEERGEDQCFVTYTMTAHFTAGLDVELYAEIDRIMSVASHNTIVKLKANAEHGVGTVAACKATRLMPV